MLAIVPVLCFAILIVVYAASCSEHGVLTRWRASFLAAAVTWGLAVTAITEVLSFFHLITLPWLVTLWVGLFLLSAAMCRAVTTREKLLSLLQFPHIQTFELWCLTGVAVIAVLVGVVAFVAPPNNADSMFYHMARVLHWIQNQTVAHYPTNILFQLFYPPWAEFAIMHFQVLSGGDQWANLVQWFSMIGSIVGVSLIARQLRQNIHGQVLAAVLVATIPMGILQGSSTQNDYVTTFWLVSLMYYVLRFKTQPDSTRALGVGASLALALLTKATAYIYAVPLVLWFTFLAIRYRRWKCWKPFFVMVALVLTTNLGHYARNFDLWGNPLGIDQQNSHPNRAFSPSVLTSNILRNMSVHIGTRSLAVDQTIRDKIEFLHTFLALDVNDPRTTLGGHFVQNWFSSSEDRAGNPIHFLLLLLSIALFFASRERRRPEDLVAYATALIAAFLIFCAFLKWEIWHSRYHLPLFVLWSPFVASLFTMRPNYVASLLFTAVLVIASIFYTSRYAIGLMILVLIFCVCFKWQPWSQANHALTFLIAGFLLAASTFYVFRNQTRPMIGIRDNKNIFNTSRMDQLFVHHPYRHLRETYYEVASLLHEQNCSAVGLVTRQFGIEYPLWKILQHLTTSKIRIEHVNVTNISRVKSSLPAFARFVPCAVIVVDAPFPEAPAHQVFSSGSVTVFLSHNLRSY